MIKNKVVNQIKKKYKVLEIVKKRHNKDKQYCESLTCGRKINNYRTKNVQIDSKDKKYCSFWCLMGSKKYRCFICAEYNKDSDYFTFQVDYLVDLCDRPRCRLKYHKLVRFKELYELKRLSKKRILKLLNNE